MVERANRPIVRVGAVSYLNSRPLVLTLPDRLPHAAVTFDVPSRLAELLAAGRIDVALVPSIEYFRQPGYRVVSDSCIACQGPVRSVRLYSRVPFERIASVALDEGSRTSVALVRILLGERFGLSPRWESLPIGAALEAAQADAALVIGDRAIADHSGTYTLEWDLGQQWTEWTGLPFVFSMWIARPHVDLTGVAAGLEAARSDGLARLESIAAQSAAGVGISPADCLSYLRDNLHFQLGPRERAGLQEFYRLAAQRGLAPQGVELVFADR